MIKNADECKINVRPELEYLVDSVHAVVWGRTQVVFHHLEYAAKSVRNWSRQVALKAVMHFD